MTGDSRGAVIRRKLAQRPAPSMVAASYSSPGMPCKPASSNSMLKPTPFQTVMMITLFLAQCDEMSQGTLGRPTDASQ